MWPLQAICQVKGRIRPAGLASKSVAEGANTGEKSRLKEVIVATVIAFSMNLDFDKNLASAPQQYQLLCSKGY